eukprot:4454387-Pleurochrysis_carterae.AAC.1
MGIGHGRGVKLAACLYKAVEGDAVLRRASETVHSHACEGTKEQVCEACGRGGPRKRRRPARIIRIEHGEAPSAWHGQRREEHARTRTRDAQTRASTAIAQTMIESNLSTLVH